MDDQIASSSSFAFPDFWSYPPYFTLQPIPETQQKQKALWRSLILSYCRHHRAFTVDVDATPPFPPFHNPAINSETPLVAHANILYTYCLSFLTSPTPSLSLSQGTWPGTPSW